MKMLKTLSNLIHLIMGYGIYEALFLKDQVVALNI